LPEALAIEEVAGQSATYRIAGLQSVTAQPGLYRLRVDATTISDLAANSGLEEATALFTITPPVTPGVLLAETGGNTVVTEGGSGDAYSLSLRTQPTAEVRISLSGPGGQLSLNRSELIFTPDNWNTPQSVAISALDDSLTEGSQVFFIQHTIESADADYSAVTIPDLAVTIQDNDGTLRGRVWNDADGNRLNNDESSLSGWTLFIDSNLNGALDPGESTAVSDDLGDYAFDNLRPGLYTIHQVLQSGWRQTYPWLGEATHEDMPSPEFLLESDVLLATVVSTINFSQANYVVMEDGTALTDVWLTRTGDLSKSVSLTLSFSDGTATGCGCAPTSVSNDFNFHPITVTFSANESNLLVSVEDAIFGNPSAIRIRNDSQAESTEYFNLLLTNPGGGAVIGELGLATITIVDDDSASGDDLIASLQTVGSEADGPAVPINAVSPALTNADSPSHTVNLLGGQDVSGLDFGNQLLPVDTTPPTATIQLDTDVLSTGETALVTITFSEEVQDLTLADLTAGSGILSDLIPPAVPGGLVWTATLTPTSGVATSGNVVSLAAGSYSDLANNPGAASTSPAYSVETLPVLPSLSITATAANQSEGNIDITNFTFTVTREGDASLPSTAAWTVSAEPNSGVNGMDFSGSQFPSGIVSFDPGQFAQLITVQVSGDTAFEADETFTITLSSPTNASIATASAEGIIRNDDLPPPEVSVSLSSVSLSEASPYAVLALTLSGPTTAPIAFTPFLDAGGTGEGFATIGIDTASTVQWWDAFHGSWMSALSGITIAPGSTSALLRTSLIDDNTFEGLETFQLHTGPLTGPVINSTGVSGTVTIADDGSTANAFDGSTLSALPIIGSADDDRPWINVSTITLSEASPFAVLAVSLSAPTHQDVSFQPTLVSGTATIGSDTGASIEWFNGTAWAAAGAGVTMAPGSTSVLLRAALNNDSDHEGPETFQIATGAVSGVRNPEGVSGTVTIVDNGSSGNTFLPGNTSRYPTVGLADNDGLPLGELSVEVLENGSETGPAASVFRLRRSGDSSAPLMVRYTLSGTAIRGLDYAPPAGFEPSSGQGVVTFGADESILDLPLTSLDDTLVDGARSINLALMPTARYNLASGAASATATIADNDVPPPALPVITLVQHAAGEPDLGGSRVVPVTLRLSEPSSTPITVGWRTTDAGSTATANVDYLSVGDGLATFAANSRTASFNVTVLGDDSSEGNESVQLELYSPVGAVFAGGATSASGLLTILDNDPGKFLSLDGSAFSLPWAISGNSLNDTLSGGAGDDLINGDLAGSGIGGDDQLTGHGGADVLTGGRRADLFRYPLLTDSTLNTLDIVVDFRASEGDRIGLAALPSALWSRGVVTPVSPSLSAAVDLVFADKDALTAGPQPLGPGEAVLFAFEATPGLALSRQWHLAVNDGSAGFSDQDDLLLRLSGSQPYAVAGNLIVPSVFSSL
jgi:hypothetical protein